LSEKKSPVFVVATANDVSMLPPELLRKGRFDEIFFVDLPLVNERKEIFKVHLSKRKLDWTKFDIDRLAIVSSEYSGAEIEEAIISAMFDTFYEKKELTTEGLLASLQQTVPLSKTMSEDVDNLRKWAKGRARPATSAEAAAEGGEERRKLEI
jgi:SpoVK/Ycf46/Vps4 family AAA+-type ATPase